MNVLEITHRWTDLQSGPGRNYVYPNPVSPEMKRQYSGPAVYRWMVFTPNDRIYAYYLGETNSLADRIAQYLRPGKRQMTNLRLKVYFDEAVSQSKRVEVQKLVFEPFQLDHVTFSMERLTHTHIRRILENFMIAWLDIENGPVVLNRVLEQDKARRKKNMDEVLLQFKRLGVTDAQVLLDKLKIASA